MSVNNFKSQLQSETSGLWLSDMVAVALTKRNEEYRNDNSVDNHNIFFHPKALANEELWKIQVSDTTEHRREDDLDGVYADNMHNRVRRLHFRNEDREIDGDEVSIDQLHRDAGKEGVLPIFVSGSIALSSPHSDGYRGQSFGLGKATICTPEHFKTAEKMTALRRNIARLLEIEMMLDNPGTLKMLESSYLDMMELEGEIGIIKKMLVHLLPEIGSFLVDRQ